MQCYTYAQNMPSSALDRLCIIVGNENAAALHNDAEPRLSNRSTLVPSFEVILPLINYMICFY